MHSGLSDSSIFWISCSSWNFWIWIHDLLDTSILDDISSCIGPTIINDPAHVPEHDILTVSTICSDTFRFTIICVRFTCSRLELMLHRLAYSIPCCHVCSIRHRTGHRDLAHSFQIIQTTRSRSLTDRFHPRLGNSLLPFRYVLMITFDSSWSILLSHLSLLPDLKHSVPFFSTCCFVKLYLLLALLFFVHGFWGPGPWLFCSRVLGSLPWLFLFLHGHLARVSTSLQFTPLV